MNSEISPIPISIGNHEKSSHPIKTLLILFGSVLWTLLFFEQNLGLNIFLFSILILIGQFLLRKKMLLTIGNSIYTVGLFISSFFVFYYGSVFPTVMFILTLIFISTIHYPEKISILTRPFLAAISCLNFWLVKWVEKLDLTPAKIKEEIKENETENPNFILKYTLLIGFSILTILLFFFLYRESNEIFRELTDRIDIDIFPQLLGFTLLGILVLNLIFNTEYFQQWSDYEMNISDTSKKNESSNTAYFKNRNTILALLLVFLNFLILFINTIDISYLLGWMPLPENVNHSEIVHGAIGSVIFSIIVAMTLILIIYKKSQNEEKINKWLLFCAFLWVLQNLILVLTTIEKNYQYILMHDLTYKRIGVMVYLFLTIVGLIIVFIKLKYDRSNWFVFRQTSQSFYLILLFLSIWNWPVIVTSYNLEAAKEKGYIDDKSYLIDLDDRNLILLANFANENPDYFQENEKNRLEEKLEAIKNTENTWQSFTISHYLLRSQLN